MKITPYLPGMQMKKALAKVEKVEREEGMAELKKLFNHYWLGLSLNFWLNSSAIPSTSIFGRPQEKMIWQYIGKIDNPKVEAAGTYLPYPNKNGSGLFILNTVTGEGWFVNGTAWTKGEKIN